MANFGDIARVLKPFVVDSKMENPDYVDYFIGLFLPDDINDSDNDEDLRHYYSQKAKSTISALLNGTNNLDSDYADYLYNRFDDTLFKDKLLNMKEKKIDDLCNACKEIGIKITYSNFEDVLSDAYYDILYKSTKEGKKREKIKKNKHKKISKKNDKNKDLNNSSVENEFTKVNDNKEYENGIIQNLMPAMTTFAERAASINKLTENLPPLDILAERMKQANILLNGTPNNNIDENTILNNISEYRKREIDEKSKIKTLLCDEQIKFDSIYVQNSISKYTPEYEPAIPNRYKISYSKKETTTPEPEKIRNVTSETLKEYNNKILLVGEEGIGKSMYVHNLYLQDLKNNNTLPFLIPLRSMLSNYKNLEIIDIIKLQLSISIPSSLNNELLNKMKEFKVVLYLDGLDEIYTKDGLNKDSLKYKIDNFLILLPTTQVIMTSRPDFEQVPFSLFTDFMLFTINRFTDNEAMDLIFNVSNLLPNLKNRIFEKRYPDHIAVVSPYTGHKLTDIDMIDEVPNLIYDYKEFVPSPLFLTILLHIYNNSVDFDLYDRKQLYERHFDILYRNNQRKNAIKDYPTKEEIKNILAELSFKMFDQYNKTKDELYSIINSLESFDHNKYSASNIEQFICEDLAYLNFQHGKYNFIHNAFKEYFAAYYIVNINPYCLYDEIEPNIDLYTFEKVLDLVNEINPDILTKYLFIPYFRFTLIINKYNFTYKEFLFNYRDQIGYYSGKIDEDKMMDDIDLTESEIYGYYLHYYQHKDRYYTFEENFENYITTDNKRYVREYYEVEKEDFNIDTERYHTDGLYMDTVCEEEAYGYTNKSDEPVGASIVFDNLSELTEETNKYLYDEVYKNDNFIYKKEYTLLKEFVEKYKIFD